MNVRLFIYVLIAACIGEGTLVVTPAQELASSQALPVAEASHDTLSKNMRCTLHQDPTGWWFVSPQGKPFFSLGVCMFNQGADKEDFNPAKPSYAALRYYDTPEAWAKANVPRLRSWGFTTAGGWSDYEVLKRAANSELWMTPVLNLGSQSGAPWFDMWDEKVVRRIKELAESSLVPLRGNPQVIGHYSDNELGWWNGALWKMTLEQPASSGQRQRLIALVRKTYGDDWSRLTQDFEPQNAANWRELDRGGMLWLRPGSDGIRAIRGFLGLVSDRYYRLMRETIHKLDPDALYLGDRYQSFYYPEVALASRRHVDVVSTNLNASWNDGTFINCYLDTLHELTGKPVLVSEFYLAAEENQSGNRNEVGGFPTVDDQKIRATALSNTLRGLACLPYVVGADWFQYYDEPPHGRKLDGEDYNFGLVDIHNRPYPEVTRAFASVDFAAPKRAAARKRPDATDGIPPAPADPFGNFRYMTALKNWDRQRGFVPPATPHPMGDLYICWKPSALFVATFVVDVAEPDYYRDSIIPESDRPSWRIQVNGQMPVTARLGCGKDAVIDNPSTPVVSLSGAAHGVRCITAIKLPAKQLGKERLAAGDHLTIESTFATHARAYRIDWKGEFVLSD